MNLLARTFAKLLFCFGIMITGVSCVVGSAVGSGTGGVPLMGIMLMIVGAGLWHKTSRKACPVCAERVTSQTRHCRHCGADLVS
jgi:hypothetical protein